MSKKSFFYTVVNIFPLIQYKWQNQQLYLCHNYRLSTLFFLKARQSATFSKTVQRLFKEKSKTWDTQNKWNGYRITILEKRYNIVDVVNVCEL